MVPVKRTLKWRSRACAIAALTLALSLVAFAQQSQSGSQNQGNPPAKGQAAQDIPDAPSTVQPPPPKPTLPPELTEPRNDTEPAQNPAGQQEAKPTPPRMPPIETLPPGSMPRNQIDATQGLYVYRVLANLVLIPVMVKDSDGHPVDGLLPKDFTVLESGKKQTLTFFTSDPFQLSVAVLIDLGMADVAVQKINETYSALAGAFSPYDEVALYTYSSTVSQVSDFSSRTDKLTAILNEIKLVHGRSAGPPVLGGPLASGPTVNGAPVGGPVIAPVNTPSREDHVLNDAILRAALDLGKRERTRRKVLFVISDGRELGSRASYRDVLRLLQSRDIQVKAVVVDQGALPVFRQAEKIHLPQHGNNIPFIRGQGFSNLLPKYAAATGGGQVFSELSRNSIEEAYAEITSEARNQYTLGYSPPAFAGSSAYRDINILIDKKGLKVFAKDGYYPAPSSRGAAVAPAKPAPAPQ